MDILKLIFAGLNVVFGLVALVAPKRLADAVGLGTENPVGIAEIRNGWGGIYLAMGVGLIVLQNPAAYAIVGMGYAGMGLTRLVQMALFPILRTPTQAGIVVFEAITAIVLVLL